MAYTPQVWYDSPATTTPVSAARLVTVENGISATAIVADAAMPKAGGIMTGALSVTARTVRVGLVDRAPVVYPNSAYVYVDKEATSADGSTVYRDQGAIKAEVGLPADNDLHLKTVTGAAGSETFTDALICKNATGYVFVPLQLGIGTVPVALLHIAGTLTVGRVIAQLENGNTGGGTSRSCAVFLKSSTVQWTIGTDAGLNAGNNFYIKDENAAERLFIDTSGQVGIGNTGPAARLDVTGDIRGSGYVKPGRFTTAGRPSAVTTGAGGTVYDTTLSKPVWSDGTVWRDAAGVAV